MNTLVQACLKAVGTGRAEYCIQLLRVSHSQGIPAVPACLRPQSRTERPARVSFPVLDDQPVTLCKAPAGLVAIESSGHRDRVMLKLLHAEAQMIQK